MNKKCNDPIGVFDSGLGGMTVVRELRKMLPHENIVYLGDTARLPYGNKSNRQIIEFSKENANFLLNQKAKAIVIACNSSSANAYLRLKRSFKVPVIDVIRPASKAAIDATRNMKIGVVGTTATIKSKAYQKELAKLNPKLKVYTASCPLFVPLIEEGWIDDDITNAIIRRYLSNIALKGIDTLILGCTHYPLLKKVITRNVGYIIKTIDSGPSAVKLLMSELVKNNLLNTQKKQGTLKVYLTDLSDHFVRLGGQFLKQKLHNVKVVKL